MAKWYFSTEDITGKHYKFIIAANSKPEAIKKGRDKAREKSGGEQLIPNWNCSLKSA